jgi:hypothetical protein
MLESTIGEIEEDIGRKRSFEMMTMRNLYYEFMRDVSLFLRWLCRELDSLMQNGYYILFLIAAMIFLLQFGVPLVVEYFTENNDDDN